MAFNTLTDDDGIKESDVEDGVSVIQVHTKTNYIRTFGRAGKSVENHVRLGLFGYHNANKNSSLSLIPTSSSLFAVMSDRCGRHSKIHSARVAHGSVSFPALLQPNRVRLPTSTLPEEKRLLSQEKVTPDKVRRTYGDERVAHVNGASLSQT